ncbi:TetR/AcrR family transcriptional regulator [Streptosporangium sp. NPDC051022]|uniref:TetR/AcrR family transcriptional regulator n=1 Tax=Streptosporangium sp. NPDC051022 TaxID=3155752 RepID=UPI0034215543
MARPSARPAIIEAALHVIEEHGVAALTLDAVAAEAGVTKRGLIYHFPTKHDLITGIHTHLAGQAEATMRRALGKDPAEATERERTIAYVRATTATPTRLDLRLMAEGAHEPDWVAPWVRLSERWFPEDGDAGSDERTLLCLIARMAADGLWGYDVTPGVTLPQALRERVIERIIELVD